MSEITAINTRSGRGKRVDVFLDGKPAFTLEADIAAKEGLQVGQELSNIQVEALAKSDQFHRCLNATLHYLNYRPRSESELRERLQQRSFDNESIEAVIVRLKEQGLVDDIAFAQFWKDNRESFNPRSKWLTKLELRRKGVADDFIDQVVDVIDDDDSAYRAALNKVHLWSLSGYQGFRHRLGGYLKRRGFSYEVINNTIERVWKSKHD
ncbi:regulatory protein RecX [Chloroflexota bacterium]